MSISPSFAKPHGYHRKRNVKMINAGINCLKEHELCIVSASKDSNECIMVELSDCSTVFFERTIQAALRSFTSRTDNERLTR